MKVNIKKLIPEASIPSYSKEEDAGMDFTATSESIVTDEKQTFGYIEYGTGIALEIPSGYVGLVFPRSSVSNTGLLLANSVGVIDSGYRGEIKFRFKWIARTAKYNIGDRIGQIIIIPYPKIELEEVENLQESHRGDSGFGSSGV